MRIKSLAQGENILMLGIEPSTFVSKIDILTATPIVHNIYDIVVGVVDIVVDVDFADIIVNVMVINVAVGDVIDGVFDFEQTCCGDWGN